MDFTGWKPAAIAFHWENERWHIAFNRYQCGQAPERELFEASSRLALATDRLRTS